MKEETVIATDAQALRDAAAAIVARVRRNEGHINVNGVLAELAPALVGEKCTWGALLRRSVVVSKNVHLASFRDQPKKTPSKATPHVFNPRFECALEVSQLSMSRMLHLATRWKNGDYEGRNDRTAACHFSGTPIYEFELVCFADLLNAIQNGTKPVFFDSAYRLLRDWGNPSARQKAQYPSGFLEHGVRQQIFDLSYYVPFEPGMQMRSILQTWAYLKFQLPGLDCSESWELLGQKLGWIVGNSNDVT